MPTVTNGQAKAILKITGIPLDCDCNRLKAALERHGGKTYKEKVEPNFIKMVLPERRITAHFDGLSATMIAWGAEIVRLALNECSYTRFEIAAILLRR